MALHSLRAARSAIRRCLVSMTWLAEHVQLYVFEPGPNARNPAVDRLVIYPAPVLSPVPQD
jgi:hypothetical protein